MPKITAIGHLLLKLLYKI